MARKPGTGKRTRAKARKERRGERLGGTELEVNVTFRHVEPTDALREYAQRKLAHITRALKRPCQAHLILSVDKYRQCGEVTVKSGPFAATAAEEDRNLYAVIDLLVDKVGRQLKRHVAKISAKRVRSPSTPEVLTAAETETV